MRAHFLTFVANFLTQFFFETLVIRVGHFVRCDVLSLGHFVPGTFCPWDVLSLGTFCLGTFCLCTCGGTVFLYKLCFCSLGKTLGDILKLSFC